jgi:phytol kinase
MNMLAEKTVAFFSGSFPSWKSILIGGPLGILWSYVCLYFAGYLKMSKGYRTGYTRKAFHFLIFATVVAIQSIWGTPIVCLFGGMCSLVVFYAILRGPGNLLYEAMAREKDEPRRTYYITVPYLTTLLGGLASNILFGHIAVVGYLVTGLGDAVGEPVGTRFGKHTYRVPSLASVKAHRSWEGSAAVFVMSAVAVAAATSLLPELSFNHVSFAAILLFGAVSAGVEAVSPHGWDNATMQVVPTFLAWLTLNSP